MADPHASTPKITGIPNEIYLKISSHLGPVSSVCLALTNKKFYRLYRELHGNGLISLNTSEWVSVQASSPGQRDFEIRLHFFLRSYMWRSRSRWVWGGRYGLSFVKKEEYSQKKPKADIALAECVVHRGVYNKVTPKWGEACRVRNELFSVLTAYNDRQDRDEIEVEETPDRHLKLSAQAYEGIGLTEEEFKEAMDIARLEWEVVRAKQLRERAKQIREKEEDAMTDYSQMKADIKRLDKELRVLQKEMGRAKKKLELSTAKLQKFGRRDAEQNFESFCMKLIKKFGFTSKEASRGRLDKWQVTLGHPYVGWARRRKEFDFCEFEHFLEEVKEVEKTWYAHELVDYRSDMASDMDQSS